MLREIKAMLTHLHSEIPTVEENTDSRLWVLGLLGKSINISFFSSEPHREKNGSESKGWGKNMRCHNIFTGAKKFFFFVYCKILTRNQNSLA